MQGPSPDHAPTGDADQAHRDSVEPWHRQQRSEPAPLLGLARIARSQALGFLAAFAGFALVGVGWIGLSSLDGRAITDGIGYFFVLAALSLFGALFVLLPLLGITAWLGVLRSRVGLFLVAVTAAWTWYLLWLAVFGIIPFDDWTWEYDSGSLLTTATFVTIHGAVTGWLLGRRLRRSPEAAAQAAR